jgi:uncharacterized iron-regulated protein
MVNLKAIILDLTDFIVRLSASFFALVFFLSSALNVVAQESVVITEGDYRIFTSEGQPATLDDIREAMGAADVVFVGELHNDPVSHYIEQVVLKDWYSTHGSAAALSLEMFSRDVQYIVDEYLNDLISESHFQLSSSPWSNYETDYKPLVEFAKANGFPVIAANAPRRYSNMVTRMGRGALNGLSDQALSYVAPQPYGAPSAAYKAQWDAVMAEAMAEMMAASQETSAKMDDESHEMNHEMEHGEGHEMGEGHSCDMMEGEGEHECEMMEGEGHEMGEGEMDHEAMHAMHHPEGSEMNHEMEHGEEGEGGHEMNHEMEHGAEGEGGHEMNHEMEHGEEGEGGHEMNHEMEHGEEGEGGHEMNHEMEHGEEGEHDEESEEHKMNHEMHMAAGAHAEEGHDSGEGHDMEHGDEAEHKMDHNEEAEMPSVGSSQHGGGSMLDAQALWDATMAWSIAELMTRKPGSKVAHMVGGFHVETGTGTPEHLAQYRPGTKMLVISVQSSLDIHTFDSDEHTGLGDFVILGDESLPRTYDTRTR